MGISYPNLDLGNEFWNRGLGTRWFPLQITMIDHYVSLLWCIMSTNVYHHHHHHLSSSHMNSAAWFSSVVILHYSPIAFSWF